MKLTWSVPQRKSGRPFSADEIDRYILSLRVEGAPDFTEIAGPGPLDTAFNMDVVDPGIYHFRLVCVPKVGVPSDPVEATAEILDTSAPVIVDFTATP